MRRHASQLTREIGIKGWKDFVVAYFACNPSGSPPTPFFPYRVRKPKSFRGSMSSTLLCPHRDQARFSATEIGNRTSRYFNLRIVSPLKRLLCTKPWNKVTRSSCAQAAPFFPATWEILNRENTGYYLDQTEDTFLVENISFRTWRPLDGNLNGFNRAEAPWIYLEFMVDGSSSMVSMVQSSDWVSAIWRGEKKER